MVVTLTLQKISNNIQDQILWPAIINLTTCLWAILIAQWNASNLAFDI